jgi:hypothetical protein
MEIRPAGGPPRVACSHAVAGMRGQAPIGSMQPIAAAAPASSRAASSAASL